MGKTCRLSLVLFSYPVILRNKAYNPQLRMCII